MDLINFEARLDLAHVVGLRQLTGHGIALGQTLHDPGELADPAPPFVTADGRIQLYGTAHYFLEWPNWLEFLGGAPGLVRPVTLRHPSGAPIRGPQAAWDLMLHRWGDETVLYAGVMTPTEGRRMARFPRDNWTRRVYAFRREGEIWVREGEPLFGNPADGWIGHSYGHHFLEDESGNPWVFYERVTQEGPNGGPFWTEIFARPMTSPYRAGEPEMPILSVGEPPFPSTRRTIGGHLVEGPRPIRMEVAGRPLYLMGFSAGDFPTDRYGINIAFSTSPLGPYRPLIQLTGEGEDILDFGSALRTKHELAWGPARPCFFQDPSGQTWVLFHAVSKKVLSGRDYTRWPDEPLHHFHRNLYLAPLKIDWPPDEFPQVTIFA